MTPQDTKSTYSLSSGPLVVTDIVRDRDSAGHPLDTFTVTMAGSSEFGTMAVVQGGVTEDLLRIFMDANVAVCVLSMASSESA